MIKNLNVKQISKPFIILFLISFLNFNSIADPKINQTTISFIDAPENSPNSKVIGTRVIDENVNLNYKDLISENENYENHQEEKNDLLEYILENKENENKDLEDLLTLDKTETKFPQKTNKETKIEQNGLVKQNGFINLDLEEINVFDNDGNDGLVSGEVVIQNNVLGKSIISDRKPILNLNRTSTSNEENTQLDPSYQVEEDDISVNELSEEQIKEIEKMNSVNNNSYVKNAIAFAISKIGFPYSQGERDSGNAYDCSSLVYYAYLNAGLDIKNEDSTTAAEIAKKLVLGGKSVSVNELKEGDLIFYSNVRNGRFHNISHVSIYIGNGQMIEASPNKGVKYSNLRLSSVTDVCRPSN